MTCEIYLMIVMCLEANIDRYKISRQNLSLGAKMMNRICLNLARLMHFGTRFVEFQWLQETLGMYCILTNRIAPF